MGEPYKPPKPVLAERKDSSAENQLAFSVSERLFVPVAWFLLKALIQSTKSVEPSISEPCPIPCSTRYR